MSEPDDEDLLAAEYVLGTLDAAERAGVAQRLGADVVLAGAVRAWEDRLAPLIAAVPEVTPPADAYAAIAARLFGTPATASPAPDVEVAALRRRLRRWRSFAGAMTLLAASLLAWVVVSGGPTPSGPQRFTAVLQRDAGAPAMVVDVDLATRRLTVRPLVAEAPAGRAYQLWIIDPALGTPRSLGLVPAGGATRESLKPFDDAVIAGATYAVSVEAAGGSPSGQPTTTPILVGKLSRFPP